MGFWDWVLLGAVWMLIPASLFLDALQKTRFRKWQGEDQKNFDKFIKTYRKGKFINIEKEPNGKQ